MIDYVVIEDDPDGTNRRKEKAVRERGVAASKFLVLKVTGYRYRVEDIYGSDEVIASRGGIDFDADSTERFTTGTFTNCAGLQSYPHKAANKAGLKSLQPIDPAFLQPLI